MQSNLFNKEIKTENRGSNTSTFVNNMKLPIHRWFRYSAGFSAEWVKESLKSCDKSTVLFDPFAGSGTTVLAGELAGIKSLGLESHPFVVRVAKAKLLWDTNVEEFQNSQISYSNQQKI